jgi:hypothetical protein
MRLPTFQPSQPSNAFRLLKTLMPLFVPRSWQDETCRFRAQARPSRLCPRTIRALSGLASPQQR